jgi:hypothetical protein
MPKFSLMRLLSSVTAICIGIGCIDWLFRTDPTNAWLCVPLYFGGGAMIGAGILTPFKRPILGAVLVVAVQLVTMAFFTAVDR